MAQEKCWLQRNWKNIIELIGGLVAGFLLTFGATAFSISILSKDAIQSLIEAEATILGFFGIIFVYIVKSLDEKESWCEKMWFDLSVNDQYKEKPVGIPKTKGELVKDRIERTKKQRLYTVRYATRVIIFLIISLLFSIFWLGTIDLALQNIKNILGISITFIGVFGVYFFFLGIVELFRMFRLIGKG